MSKAVPAPSGDLQNDLGNAYRFFNDKAGMLSNSYWLLKGKVDQLTRELNEVSAQKDEELEQKNQLAYRMQTLLDFLPGGVIVLDAKGCVVQSNPAARAMLSHSLDGHSWRSLIASCFCPREDDGLDISTVDGKQISLETASLSAEGQIILLTDQTEKRKLQKQVGHYEKLSAMGKMVSALAHQIRTPLSAAILYANHLCAGQLDPQKQGLFSKKLLGRLNHMEKQVRDMLLFVRNELPMNDVITLQDLEEGLRAAMEVPLATSKSRCIWENPNPGVMIRCNREALISALLNLVNNAVQASGSAAKMKISFCRTALSGEPAIAIAVADNGPGMSSDQLKDAQEMFYTTKPQGTGLGLAVVNSVARAHGGYFKLQSKLGIGTCGTIAVLIEQAKD